MDELLELAKQHAAQELEIRRTCREIREKADKLGYEEAYVIDDPIHFQIAGIRFTPKRIFGEACKAPEQPEGTPASMPVEPMADLSGSNFVGDGMAWDVAQDGPLNSLPNGSSD